MRQPFAFARRLTDVAGTRQFRDMSATDSAGPEAVRRRSAEVRTVLLRILVLNLVVVVVKTTVGVRTGSLAVLGAALESLLDMLNSVVGIIAVTVAARAPDEDHPYGHGKFETLGALAIVGFLSISCFELLRGAVRNLARGGGPPAPEALDMALLVGTAAINLFVVSYERKRGRALGSAFLLADAEHTRADIYVTALAIASLGLTQAGLARADAVLGIVVAALIARSGIAIIRATVPVLVDQRGADESEIRGVVEKIPRIASVRSIRSRSGAGGLLFADVTIAVEGSITVAEAHALADAVEERIESRLGPSEVVVHVEPR
ncbi:MAG TPA: cation diffusion facilitator family transporter [Gemmatimonadaceae bacterium]|nr:cation diffusion facilitator family transporter [Gemmatimonadaceae bacterium]